MNIYEDERLEEKFNEITDQLGHLFLDFLCVTLAKLNNENQVYSDFENIRGEIKQRKTPF